jgi:putative toxin-antitoxin system antitoxin component (TIGR02293 family)
LRPDQSDRLFRIARIIDFAQESIGTRAQALEWLHVPNQAMQGSRPIIELDTDAGAKRVEAALERMREGIVD